MRAEGDGFLIFNRNRDLSVSHAVFIFDINQIRKQIKQFSAFGDFGGGQFNRLIRAQHLADVCCQRFHRRPILIQRGGFQIGEGLGERVCRVRAEFFVHVGLQDGEISRRLPRPFRGAGGKIFLGGRLGLSQRIAQAEEIRIAQVVGDDVRRFPRR
ncbi:MAG: hypothetical protein DYG85_04810 [Chloroflexi bacterium CFX1]|nr:hypothetical protein [Chloroflexi bacterium CFX1]